MDGTKRTREAPGTRCEVFIVIPARGESKGIPRKNLQDLDGHPLLAWSIATGLSITAASGTLVSTEDVEIANVARRYGARVIERPPDLATDEAPTEPVLLHAMEAVNASHEASVALLQPTSPLRRRATVEHVITPVLYGHCTSALTVRMQHPFRWKANACLSGSRQYARRGRRQDLDPSYLETGSVYVTRVDALRATGDRVSGSTRLVPVDSWEALDIDGRDELDLVRALAPHWPASERPHPPDSRLK